MKKFISLAALVCFAALNVNAQEAESPIGKGERLAKAADEAPQDWQRQYDVAKFYLKDPDGPHDQTLGEKYATRALEIAQSQTEKRDTILGKSFELMSILGMFNKNIEQALGYYDQAIRAYVDELGYNNAAIPPRIAYLASLKWMLYAAGGYANGNIDAVKAFREAFILNNQLPEGQKAEGLQDAVTLYALSLETLLTDLKQLMKDMVWQWTDQDDGKTYTILACDDWTMEQSAGFIATMRYAKQNGKKESQYGFWVMDEEGNITERKPSEFLWNTKIYQEGNAYSMGDASLRVVSISAKKRQQMLEAYHKHVKKAKKNKKQ